MVPTKHNESARELALEVVWVFAFHPGLCRKGALSFVWAVRVYPPRFGAIIAHDTMPQRTGTGWHRVTAQVRKLGKIKLASGQCNGKIAGIPQPNKKGGEAAPSLLLWHICGQIGFQHSFTQRHRELNA